LELKKIFSIKIKFFILIYNNFLIKLKKKNKISVSRYVLVIFSIKVECVQPVTQDVHLALDRIVMIVEHVILPFIYIEIQ
jgi:hypothetical protein